MKLLFNRYLNAPMLFLAIVIEALAQQGAFKSKK
jgi:hypothetical protein